MGVDAQGSPTAAGGGGGVAVWSNDLSSSSGI